RGPLGDLALLAHHLGDPFHLGRGGLQQLDDVVEGLGNGGAHAGLVTGQPGGEVTLLDRPQGREEFFGVEVGGGASRFGRHYDLSVTGGWKRASPRSFSTVRKAGEARTCPRQG